MLVNHNPPQPALHAERILAIDVLRGAVIFALIFLGPFSAELAQKLQWNNALICQLRHATWEGLTVWDMVMPLFIFLAGASLPLAVAQHYQAGWSSAALWRRLARRLVLLWLLGMIAQGNLLALTPTRIYLFSNVLQAIAVGALIATPLIMYTERERWLIAALLGLSAIYTVVLFYAADGATARYAMGENFAEIFDRALLGRFTDGARTVDGATVFNPHYHYAWLLPSLNFGALTLAGALAGKILQARRRRLLYLLIAGGSLIAASFAVGAIEPCIKKLFTTTFTWRSAGIAFLMLAIFYYVLDVRQWRRGAAWLRIYGANALLAYLLSLLLPTGAVTQHFLHGLPQYVGEFYPLCLRVADAGLIFWLLRGLYQARIFIRV